MDKKDLVDAIFKEKRLELRYRKEENEPFTTEIYESIERDKAQSSYEKLVEQNFNFVELKLID